MNVERHLVEWGRTTESCVNKEVMALKTPACEWQSVDLGSIWIKAPCLLVHRTPWARVSSTETLAVDTGAWSCLSELIVIGWGQNS